MKIVFGPIKSRRFGNSLGVDLSPEVKQCNFDCLYCELKPSVKVEHYNRSISPEDVLREIKSSLKIYRDIDVLTFTANGEPTLYPYLDIVLDEVKGLYPYIKTLILSNGSTIYNSSVQKILKKFHTVKLSLDCLSEECFKKVDRAVEGVKIGNIRRGIEEFSEKYDGELVIEILIVKGLNDREDEIKKISNFLSTIKLTRVDLGTLDRPPAYRVKPVTYQELFKLSMLFPQTVPINIIAKRDSSKKRFHFNEEQIISTLKRRPLTDEDLEELFDDSSKENLYSLLKRGLVITTLQNKKRFYVISDDMI
jgi:wyosine [tRNA(Phe)-imidazoG37] synthetase (radical SAM superfamily)